MCTPYSCFGNDGWVYKPYLYCILYLSFQRIDVTFTTAMWCHFEVYACMCVSQYVNLRDYSLMANGSFDFAM